MVTWLVVPVSGPRPDPGASETVTGTDTPAAGEPEPSTIVTVNGGPDWSNGLPVRTAPTAASAGAVPNPIPHCPATGVVRLPVMPSPEP